MKYVFTLLLITVCIHLSAQEEVKYNLSEDEKIIREIFDEVLVNGECYPNLRELCKNIGGRLSGSPEAEKAVQWGKQKMEASGADKVWLQKIKVPRWVRGEKETAELLQTTGSRKLNICALGGSVGTGEAGISGEIVEVKDFSELEALGEEKLKGKIVFYNRPMEPEKINTFHAYSGCVNQRTKGASEAAEYGAIGVLVRSMNLVDDDHPHTGVMRYENGVEKIPAAAVSTNDANLLSRLLKEEKSVKVKFKMSCKNLPDVTSYNVIGEIKGSKEPEKIILVGGHLDSWDNGEGAHDDGAGCVQSIEILRILKAMGIKPKYTIRAVLFMNEENGNNGGKSYAAVAKERNELHVAAVESDRGGFSPRGFSIDASDVVFQKVASWRQILEPYGLHFFEEGFAGVDIYPLREENVPLFGLVPDSQRYFDYHHSPADVFEAVNKRELELGAASMAALIFLIDKYGLE